MQAGFERTEGYSRKLLNFIEFVPFGVVQQHHDAMFFAQSCEGCSEPPVGLVLLSTRLWLGAVCDIHVIFYTGRGINSLDWLPSIRPLIVDELVEEHSPKPRGDFSNAGEFVAASVELE